MKKVSIVTITYNDLSNLKKTMDGIFLQDYPDVECVIVDGGSKDGTPEYLASLQEAMNQKGWQYRYVSEKDEGLYDALTKGFKMATGDIVGVMYDRFAYAHALSDMVEIMEKEGTDGVHGDAYYLDENDKPVRKWVMGNTLTIQDGWMPSHTTLYLKREVYEKYGYYNNKYKIAGDYDFMVRMLKDGTVKLSYLEKDLVEIFYGGTSNSSFGSYVTSFMEASAALKENGYKWCYLNTFKRMWRVFSQFFKAKKI